MAVRHLTPPTVARFHWFRTRTLQTVSFRWFRSALNHLVPFLACIIRASEHMSEQVYEQVYERSIERVSERVGDRAYERASI